MFQAFGKIGMELHLISAPKAVHRELIGTIPKGLIGQDIHLIGEGPVKKNEKIFAAFFFLPAPYFFWSSRLALSGGP